MLKLCAVDDSGFCQRCQIQVVNSITGEEQSCPDFSSEVSHFNDDGEWDYEGDDKDTIEEILETL